MRLAKAARFLAAQKVLIGQSSGDAHPSANGQQQHSVGLQHKKQQHLPKARPPPHHSHAADLGAVDSNSWHNKKVLRNNKKLEENNKPQQQLCDPHSAEPDIGILSCGTLYYCAESQDSVLGGICTPAASAYTTSSRHLQEGSGGLCLSPEASEAYYDCDCTNFDPTNNTGSYECQLLQFTGYCCESDGTPICLNVTIAANVSAGPSNITYCYDFTSPYEIGFCANFAGSKCTITIDGVECNSCQVVNFCSTDRELTYYGFDCTNIAASGRRGSCEDYILPIIEDFISDACVEAGVNTTMSPMGNITDAPSALGTIEDMMAPTMSPSSVDGTGLPFETPTPVPSDFGSTNVTMTTDISTSGNSSIGIIVGVCVAVIVLLMLAFGSWWYQKRCAAIPTRQQQPPLSSASLALPLTEEPEPAETVIAQEIVAASDSIVFAEDVIIVHDREQQQPQLQTDKAELPRFKDQAQTAVPPDHQQQQQTDQAELPRFKDQAHTVVSPLSPTRRSQPDPPT